MERETAGRDRYKRGAWSGAEQGKPGPRPPAAPSPAAASALLPTVPGYRKLGFKCSVLPRLGPQIKSLHEKKWKK